MDARASIRWRGCARRSLKTEPNSGLGQAIDYMRRHWQPLTLFLRRAGAPLDNNLVERSLKKAILHRKNALYYKTENGARVGDLYMSLIHTCELNGVYSLDYLTELQRHAEELRGNPAAWMPWNYGDTLAQTAECGGISKSEIARRLNICRTSVRRVLSSKKS